MTGQKREEPRSWLQERFKARTYEFTDGAGGRFSVGYRMKPPFPVDTPMEGLHAFALAYFVGVMVKVLLLPGLFIGVVLAYFAGRQLRHLPIVKVKRGFNCWLEVEHDRLAHLVERARAQHKRIEVTYNARDPKARTTSRIVAVALGSYLEQLGGEYELVSGNSLGVNLEGRTDSLEDSTEPRDVAEAQLANGELEAIIYSFEPASGLLAYLAERACADAAIYARPEDIAHIRENPIGAQLSLRVLGSDPVVTPCVVFNASPDEIYNMLDRGQRGISFYIFRNETVQVPHWTRVSRIAVKGKFYSVNKRPQLSFSRIGAEQ